MDLANRPALLPYSNDLLKIEDFVNADTIAQGLCAFEPEKVAIQAGKIMLDRLKKLSEAKVNFAFETTLASKSFAPWITKLRTCGYRFHLVYLWLINEELAILRVNERVQMGGHYVPSDTIKRRYNAGLKNFFHLYQPIADTWHFHNNSDAERLRLIASGTQKQKIIHDALLWNALKEKFDDKKL